MALRETDISWQVLRSIVRDWAGTAAELSEVRTLVGGCVNTTLALQTGRGQRAVLKIAPHRVNTGFMREAMQLRLLRELGLPVPEVYAWKIASLEDPHSYLLMEYVEGVDLANARKRSTPEQMDALQRHLAELVAILHGNRGQKYQRVADSTTESYDSWPDFYRSVYQGVVREAEKLRLLPPAMRRQLRHLHDQLARLLRHDDQPRLVHWDLWSGNILAACDMQGRWRITALLDPNCKYAHAEAEIAYMELFRTVTPAFLQEYQKSRRLSEEYYRVRKWVYQVYPLVNHVHLFGQPYVKPLAEALEKALACS